MTLLDLTAHLGACHDCGARIDARGVFCHSCITADERRREMTTPVMGAAAAVPAGRPEAVAAPIGRVESTAYSSASVPADPAAERATAAASPSTLAKANGTARNGAAAQTTTA